MSLINVSNVAPTVNTQSKHKKSPKAYAYEQPQLHFDNKVKRLVVPLYCGTCRAYGCQCYSNPINQLTDTSINFSTVSTSEKATFTDNTSFSTNSIHPLNEFYNTSTSSFSPVQFQPSVHNYQSHLNNSNNNLNSSKHFYHNQGLLNNPSGSVNGNFTTQQQLFANFNKPSNLFIYGNQETLSGTGSPNTNAPMFNADSNKQENLSTESIRLRKYPFFDKNSEKKRNNRHSNVVDSFYFNNTAGNSSYMTGYLASNKSPGSRLTTSQFIESDKNMSSQSFSSNSSNVDSSNFKDVSQFRSFKHSNNSNPNNVVYYLPNVQSNPKQMYQIKVIYQNNKKLNNNKNSTNANNRHQNKSSTNNTVRNKKFAAYESILSSSQQTSTSSSLSSSPTPLLDHFSTFQYAQFNNLKPNGLKATHQQTVQVVPCRLGNLWNFLYKFKLFNDFNPFLIKKGNSCRYKRENKCKYYHPPNPQSKIGKHKNENLIDISDYSIILNETGINLDLNLDDLPELPEIEAAHQRNPSKDKGLSDTSTI